MDVKVYIESIVVLTPQIIVYSFCLNHAKQNMNFFSDLGLDVHCASISDLDEEEVKTINACSWKLFLLSHDMLDQVQNAKVIIASDYYCFVKLIL